MRRAGETVTNTQTPESIAEREFIAFWRERAAQQNIEIRNSLMRQIPPQMFRKLLRLVFNKIWKTLKEI
jgi:hypothetical protein